MSRFKLLIFDLDGTLIDSKEDIAESVNLTLKYLEQPMLPIETICSHVGLGVGYLLDQCLPENHNLDLQHAKKIFLSIYEANVCQKTKLYPGVLEGLKSLSNFHNCILTNKPEKHSLICLKQLNIIQYFTQIIGGDSLPVKKPDPNPVFELLKYFHISPEESLMIGDSPIDAQTAINAKIPYVLVDYGFSTYQSLEVFQPALITSDFLHVIDYIQTS